MSFATHAIAGATTNAELTFKPDHPKGVGHTSTLWLAFAASKGIGLQVESGN
jgi:hypothetical protein